MKLRETVTNWINGASYVIGRNMIAAALRAEATTDEVSQLPQDSHIGALPNAPGVLGSSAEFVRAQKCQQAGNDHEGRWKAEG